MGQDPEKADESGAVIYRQSETPDVYKEEAESVMIVMSTAAKGLKGQRYFLESPHRQKLAGGEKCTVQNFSPDF